MKTETRSPFVPWYQIILFTVERGLRQRGRVRGSSTRKIKNKGVDEAVEKGEAITGVQSYLNLLNEQRRKLDAHWTLFFTALVELNRT